ncbi:MAG: hypothetical protein ACREDY_24525, partial [Bradyrhizobium sp.]
MSGGNHNRPPQTRGKLSQQQAIQMVNSGQLAPIDRYNRIIREGDLVEWHAPKDFVFIVNAITPVLDPRQQGHLITLQLLMPGVAPLTTMANQPNPSLRVIGRMVKREDGSAEMIIGTIEAKESDLLADMQARDDQEKRAAAEA